MNKIFIFYKTYFEVILFTLAILLCITLTSLGMMSFRGISVGLVMALSPIGLAIIGYWIQKFEKTVSQPSTPFTIAWYIGFALLMVVMIVCIIISYYTDKRLPLLIILIVSYIAFVSMFGNLVIIAFISDRNNQCL